MNPSIVKYTSPQDVKTHLDIDLNDEQITALNLAGQTPTNLLSNSIACDTLVTGFCASDINDIYLGTQFDFNSLINEFKMICPEMNEPLGWETKSKALQFSAEIIYKVGPVSRRLKKYEGDKSWKFRFVTKTRTVFVIVSTYKTNAPPSEQPKVHNNILALTVKQAGLLATQIICKLVLPMVEKGKILMTPLSGAIFSRDDIPAMLEELGIIDNSSNRASFICSLISSCQSGGQYLEHSKCHIAICAALCATKNMKDRRLAMDICRKIERQYISCGKQMHHDQFLKICKFVTGGIPAEYEPSKPFAEMEEIQKLTRKNLRDIESTSSVVLAQAPGPSTSTGGATRRDPGACGSSGAHGCL